MEAWAYFFLQNFFSHKQLWQRDNFCLRNTFEIGIGIGYYWVRYVLADFTNGWWWCVRSACIWRPKALFLAITTKTSHFDLILLFNCLKHNSHSTSWCSYYMRCVLYCAYFSWQQHINTPSLYHTYWECSMQDDDDEDENVYVLC